MRLLRQKILKIPVFMVGWQIVLHFLLIIWKNIFFMMYILNKM